jgi:hypothetical protein
MRAILSNPNVALRRAIVASALTVIVFVACDDPTGQGYLTPTLETIWPNDDGRYWAFDIVDRTWDESGVPVYAAPEEVPPVTLDDIEDFLEGFIAPGPNLVIDEGTYTLRFVGETPIPGGRLVQNLREELAGPRPEKPVHVGTFEDALLARLARARPDLREKIAARLGGREIPSSTLQLEAALILHGGAWEKTLSGIGTYGDLDDQFSWLYLDATLLPRSEFHFQLVPSLADDVYLHCRILQRTTINTRIGRLRGALECLYVVDYGVAPIFDQETPGYFRLIDYGIVTYAPFVGPVQCLERRFEAPGTPIGSLERRAGDTWLDIFGTGLPEESRSTSEAR